LTTDNLISPDFVNTGMSGTGSVDDIVKRAIASSGAGAVFRCDDGRRYELYWLSQERRQASYAFVYLRGDSFAVVTGTGTPSPRSVVRPPARTYAPIAELPTSLAAIARLSAYQPSP
jgi:hypothetical protein